MSETKYCGNCKHFMDEGVDGFGFCVVFKCIHHCTGGGRCDAYQLENNGWTEITPDNVDDLYPVIDRVMVAYKLGEGLAEYRTLKELYKPLIDLALTGGYYYIVLPELKIKDE